MRACAATTGGNNSIMISDSALFNTTEGQPNTPVALTALTALTDNVTYKCLEMR